MTRAVALRSHELDSNVKRRAPVSNNEFNVIISLRMAPTYAIRYLWWCPNQGWWGTVWTDRILEQVLSHIAINRTVYIFSIGLAIQSSVVRVVGKFTPPPCEQNSYFSYPPPIVVFLLFLSLPPSLPPSLSPNLSPPLSPCRIDILKTHHFSQFL